MSVRLASLPLPVDFCEICDQKPPMSWFCPTAAIAVMGLVPQRIVSSAPGGVALGSPEVPFQTLFARPVWVAQNPCVRVVPIPLVPLFRNVHVTLSPHASVNPQ